MIPLVEQRRGIFGPKEITIIAHPLYRPGKAASDKFNTWNTWIAIDRPPCAGSYLIWSNAEMDRNGLDLICLCSLDDTPAMS